MKAPKPVVSIIIPAYNVANYVERAVASIYEQQLPSFEVLIVDNNSTDNTREVLDDLAKRHKELLVLSEHVQGIPAARNRGLIHASGEFIQFLDADDVLLAGKVARQLAIFTQDTDVVFGSYRVVNMDGSTYESFSNTDAWKGIVTGGIGDSNANMYRKSTLRDIGGFDELLLNAEDLDLYFRLLVQRVNYRNDHVIGSLYIHRSGERVSFAEGAREFANRFGRAVKVIKYLKENRPIYFRENQFFFVSRALQELRFVIGEDAQLGYDLYDTNAEWLPLNMATERSMLPAYTWLYQVVGFTAVERIRKLYHRIKGSFS